MDYVNGDNVTITYGIEDDRPFTNIKILSKMKLKDRPKSSNALQIFPMRRNKDGTVIRRTASLSSVEDLFLLRRCPLIRPLLSETEISRFKKIREKCKAKKIMGHKDTIQDDWIDFSGSSTLHLPQVNFIREQDKIGALYNNDIINVDKDLISSKLVKEEMSTGLRNPSPKNIPQLSSKLVKEGITAELTKTSPKNIPQLSSKLVKEGISTELTKTPANNIPKLSNKLVKEGITTGLTKTSPKNVSQLMSKLVKEGKTSELTKTSPKNLSQLSSKLEKEGIKTGLTKTSPKNGPENKEKLGNKKLRPKSSEVSMETKNEERKTKPTIESSKNIANKANLVKRSNKSGKQESETKSDIPKFESRNIVPNKEGSFQSEKGNINTTNSRQKKQSIVDIRDTSPKSKQNLSKVKGSSKDMSSLSDKTDNKVSTRSGVSDVKVKTNSNAKKKDSENSYDQNYDGNMSKAHNNKVSKSNGVSDGNVKTTSKAQKKDSEKSNDENYNGDISKDAKSVKDKNKSKQPPESPSTRASQGQDKDVAKSPKGNVTKQTPLSTKTAVANSKAPSEIISREGSKNKRSKKLSSLIEYVIQYVLSDPVFLKIGWTLKNVDKTLSTAVTFKANAANPHSYCFRPRSEAEIKHYPNGKLAVNMRKGKTGEVYYPNGNLAILLQTSRTGMRLVLYENPKNNLSGKGRAAVPVIGVFDSFGNGVLYDEKGEKSLVFNQLKGILNNPDKKIQYKWKWNAYEVLEKQRLKELLRSMVEEKEKVPTGSITGGNPPVTQKARKSEEKPPELDRVYESILSELPLPVTKDKKFKKYNSSSLFKPIVVKVNKEITLRINGQDKVVIQFWADKVSHSLDLGVIVDPHGVERIDEIDPGKLSEVPCVFNDLLRPSPSLEHLRIPTS